MTAFSPFAIALRLSGVTLDQAALETALGAKVSRFEPEDAPQSHYAQIDIDSDNPTRAIIHLAANIGPRVKTLVEERQIGQAVLDIALDFPEDGEAMSTRLPAHMAAAIANCDIDLEISVYLVDEADDDED
ncbi:hypothetical protein [Devosia sp.]|uniref:hypothetical protein n=1 Tax=Devosia sp. TaxID=1871048 RepID=UPI00326790FF